MGETGRERVCVIVFFFRYFEQQGAVPVLRGGRRRKGWATQIRRLGLPAGGGENGGEKPVD